MEIAKARILRIRPEYVHTCFRYGGILQCLILKHRLMRSTALKQRRQVKKGDAITPLAPFDVEAVRRRLLARA